jgi:large repetitive protein
MLNRIRPFLAVLFLLLGFSTNASASHAVGVDLTYTCIDPVTNTYRFTVRFYRDCSGISPSTPVLNFSSTGGCGTISNVTMAQVGGAGAAGQVDVSQLCNLSTSRCATPPGTNQGTGQWTYTANVVLPPGCNSWVVSYAECCRSGAITNLLGASSNDLFTQTTINTALAPCNSSPQFSNTPVLYTCAGQQTFYNHGTFDPDGDSLVYTLVNPRDDATTNIAFSGTLSATTPLVLQAATSFVFNSATGQMTFTPIAGQAQVAIISVQVSEFRNGVLIGTTIRDVQVVVLTTCTNTAPNVNSVATPNGVVSGTNINVCGGNTVSFSATITDPNVTDILTVTSDITTSIPSATYTTSGTNPVVITFLIPTNGLATGSYPFTVNIRDNACPISGFQSIGYQLNLSNLEASSTQYFKCANEVDTMQLFADGLGGAAAPGTYSWSPTTGLSNPNIFNPILILQEPETYIVTYTDGVCVQHDTVVISAPYPALINPIPTVTLCNGNTAQLNATVAAGPGPQVFTNNTSRVITANATTDVVLNVAGVAPSTLLSSSIASICLNISQPGTVRDLNLVLIAPNGQFITLTNANGSSVQTSLTNVCFSPTAVTPITNFSGLFATIPGNASYLPQGNLNTFAGGATNGAWTLRIVHTKPAASGGQNGTFNNISITFNDLSAATFAWSPNYFISCTACPNPIVSPPVDTVYQVTAQNLFGCRDTAFVSVLVDTALPAPTIICDSTSTNLVRFGWNAIGGAAAYRLTVNGGASFTVTNTSLTHTVPGLSIGQCATLTVQAISGNTCLDGAVGTHQCCASGCGTIDNVPITPNGPTSICLGSTVGLDAGVGSAYLWSNGATTRNITASLSGTYAVSVSDAIGCIDTGTIIINALPGPIPTIIANGSTTLCAGESVGLDAGAGFNTYLWSTGATTQTINATTDGLHTVTVSDALACLGTDDISVTVGSAVSISIATTNTTCNTNNTTTNPNDGSAIATPSGGFGGYIYLWSIAAQTTANATGLSSGTNYNLTVTDSNNCTATATTSVAEPSAISLTMNSAAVSCHSGSNGSASAVPTGGASASYTFLWSNGETTSTITGLTTGNYTVTACVANCCISGSVSVSQPTAPLSLTINSITNVSCFGGNDGAVDIVASDGTAPYSFIWNTGQTSSTATGLTATIACCLTATDANLCEAVICTTITEPTAVSATAASSDATCNGGTNGFVAVTAAGGTGTYFYLWNTGATTDNILNIGAAAYAVTVSDVNNCTTIAFTTINEPSQVSVTASITSNYNGAQITCAGATDGVANATTIGGTGAFSFLWTNGQTNAIATGLAAGQHCVTATDASGCNISTCVTLVEPSAVSVTASAIDATCFGLDNGTASAVAAGGTGAYSFIWSNSGTTSNITALFAGTYTITASDANNCSAVATTTVAEPAASVATTVSSTPALCSGNPSGTATVTPSGGVSPYTFVWANNAAGQTTATATGLTAGSYDVTVTDFNGCPTTASVTVADASGITLAMTSSPTSCFGVSDGTATANASGGAGGFSFLWSNAQTTAIATGFAAGNHCVTATDINGCIITACVDVNQPQGMSNVQLTSVGVSCFGGNNGSATVSLSGGIQPYSFLWSNNQTLATATNFPAGAATVTITDANGCTTTGSTTITEPTELTLTTDTDSVFCRFGNTGMAEAIAVGGTFPYSFLWSNGRNTAINNNLVAGSYAVTVTDFNNCRVNANVTIGQPATAVLANIIQSNNPTCNSFTNGDATVNGSGGTPNYTFVWSNGQTSVTATGLGAGSYQVTVIDQRGCTATANTNLSQPSALVATASVFSNYNGADVTCPNAADGIARVLVSGGAGGYSYVWSTVPVQNTAIANNLTAGTYQVTVSDVSGCQLVRSVTLVNPVPLAATETNIDVFCNGGNTGQIIVNATPNTGTIGINGYEYAIFGPNQVGNVFSGNNSFFGLSVGTYTIVVRDGNNCTLPVSVAITEPTVLALAVSNTAVTCFGTATGTATAVATGGVAPYTFRWSNGQSTAMATALAAGGYAVTATDANGCDRVQQTIITEPTVLQATVATQGVSCNGGNNGTATVTAQGGTAPYTFRWSNSQTAQTANALIAGAANVTVTDANNCQTIINFTITEPLGLTASVSPQAVTCGGGSNGQATANPLGGTAPYTYLWVNGQTAQTATGLTAGTYSVVVSDANGCQTNATTTINQPSALNILVSSFTDTRCSNSTDGTATAQASGGTAPYRFAWSNGQTTLTATGLAANTNYNVTVTDANGCQNQTLISVGSPTAIQLNNFTIVDVTCRGGNNGRAGTFATGGTPPYSFRWSNNQTTATATGLIAGLYSLTVTDANGCATSGQATISQPTQSLSMFLNSTPSLCAGEPSGQVVAVPGGGTPLAGNTYVYQWSNGATTRILSGVIAGNYSVTVTDANGCSLSQSAMVGNGGGVQIQAQVLQNITCGGGSNGRANAVASTTNGGSASLIWSTGATTNNISGLSAGTYTVSATDANGCTAVDTIVINDGLQVAATAAIQSVSCFGLADGAINVTASPVGVLYEWSNAFVSNDGNISGLTAGVYTVTVTVALGCTQSFTYNLGEPTELNTSISTTANVLCFGGTEGALTAVANGGTAPYTYLWNDGNTNSLRDTLTAGGYTLIVTDANGCSVTNTALLEEPAALVLTSESTGTTCSDSEDGQIAVSAEGGTANLGLYEFSTDGENWQTGNLFPNLAANAYTVFVRDANNCMDSAIINIDAADPFFIITTTADTSIIFGDTLTLAVTMNDTTGALLVWSQLGAGGSVLDSNVLSIIVTPSDATQYQFVATNSNGCQVDTTILVEVDKPRDANAPKGFTPNGDGINDQFFIQGDGSKITAVRALRVYDRWGELVFDGADMTVNDATQGWDGTFRGKNVSSGIFAWYAEIEFIDGFVLVLKGDITLLR